MGPVEAVTGSGTRVQETEATLNGTVNPRGYNARYYFQYGETTSYGSTTPELDAGAGASPESVHMIISGLTPGVTYHFRVVAASGGVTSYGTNSMLTTLPANQYVAYAGTSGAVWGVVVDPHQTAGMTVSSVERQAEIRRWLWLRTAIRILLIRVVMGRCGSGGGLRQTVGMTLVLVTLSRVTHR